MDIPNYLIKFAYDASGYTGFQRGNGDRSIEGTIEKHLAELGVFQRIRSAARTDRLVSALGNAFTVSSERDPEDILSYLNASIEDMLFYAYARVAEGFNPRHCKMKQYRYHITGNNINAERLERILSMFQGTHDFRNFAKADRRNTVRRIDRIEVMSDGDTVTVDFYAQSFIWHQIRSIMGFALHYVESEEVPEPFSLQGRNRFLAEPEYLVLVDIEYEGVQFRHTVKRSKLEGALESYRKHSVRASLWKGMADRAVGGQ
ncbi:tRNA pseudouridine(38-40) synthase TruA [Thermogymnomonas acidicola]|uniref:tRNA pseudouridine synthase A n=1 Tax=Thermogymnomonas acidicola TaxID=399579 RepID=A0AA37FA29_9ARCH|nr:tRNA pseudouridine(38-40) synthase TruA [Thermogymnomonas acidicola]GGM78424.1 tRNA pseudouridine(38-40) synthase TruA [Thermogymnomonas acidicola]